MTNEKLVTRMLQLVSQTYCIPVVVLQRHYDEFRSFDKILQLIEEGELVK